MYERDFGSNDFRRDLLQGPSAPGLDRGPSGPSWLQDRINPRPFDPGRLWAGGQKIDTTVDPVLNPTAPSRPREQETEPVRQEPRTRTESTKTSMLSR